MPSACFGEKPRRNNPSRSTVFGSKRNGRTESVRASAARAREFLATYDDAPLARHFVERLEEEIEQYRRYGRRYGYVFYIGQRTE